MTSKKPKPKLPPSKVTKAATAAPPKSGRTARSAALPPLASDPAESTAGQLVRLHDLTGVALFYLPAQLREILGAQLLAQQLEDLRRTQLTLIVRTAGEVIYVDLPLVFTTLSADVAAAIDAAKASEAAAARRSDQANRDA